MFDPHLSKLPGSSFKTPKAPQLLNATCNGPVLAPLPSASCAAVQRASLLSCDSNGRVSSSRGVTVQPWINRKAFWFLGPPLGVFRWSVIPSGYVKHSY